MTTYLAETEQGGAEWHAARAGHAMASKFGDILAGKKTRETYLWQVIGERLCGQAKRSSGSQSMDWGKEAETLAREEYVVQTGELVDQVGFALHSSIKFCGASSDGLVGDVGCIEIKSPFTSGVHSRTWFAGMPVDHEAQVQGNLWILEREWLDFLSYDPAFSRPLNLYRQRVVRNEKYITNLENEVKNFLAEVNVNINEIMKKAAQ